ncbi:MAG TPA: DNA polymerase Y family protein [Burkholderiales bacterium]|jgi:protein ImuB
MLWVALRFPLLPQATLEAIGAWACQFTPKVSLEPPQALLLEVEGSLRLFGGLPFLKQKLRSGLEEMGFDAALATGATPRAALWLSSAGCERIDEVPLEVVCHGETREFLHSIGMHAVGELSRLPREGLARRCGRELLDEIDRALGALPEPRAFFEPPQRFSARLELPAPVVHAEGLAFAARRLLVQLEGLLAARQAGVRQFSLVLVDGEAEARVDLGLASPARDAERFIRLLQERLASLCIARPVEAIRVEAADFVPLAEFTAGMFGDAAAEAEDWARLAERLRARLGHDAVCGLATYPEHRPEHAWRRVEPGEWDPHEYRQPGPRPLWLLEPRKIKEGGFVTLAGPERIESGWWDGDEASRDYFVARLPDGALAWVYRETGASSARWFLHGLFA